MTSLTQQAQERITSHLLAGDIVVDATCGNGFDTVFLAEQVGPSGHVFAFDIQALAIKNTLQLLKEQSLEQQVTVTLKSHDTMKQVVPVKFHKKISTVMFNLGYLPGSDKSCITTTDSTISALKQSLFLLKDDGCLSIMLYPGHEGGQDETDAVIEWTKGLSENWKIEHTVTAGPQWLLIQPTIFSNTESCY